MIVVMYVPMFVNVVNVAKNNVFMISNININDWLSVI